MINKPFVHFLKTPLNFYIFDVNTNQILSVSKGLYNALKSLIDFPTTETENLDAIREFEGLKVKGYLSSKRPKEIKHHYSDLLNYELEYSIHQMTLQVTQECNFRCSYCTYTSESFNTQRRHAPKKMTRETAIKAIDFLARHSIRQDNIVVGFYGGEPLLEFELIREVMQYAKKMLDGKEVLYTITTNGTVLTDEIIDFLDINNVNLSISLDGVPEIHDKSRKFAKNGKGTFSVIERNLKKIRGSNPRLYKRIMFNCVIDPRNPCDVTHYMFSDNDIFKEATVMSTLIDDFFTIEKAVESEDYSIESSRHRFKSYLAEFGRYPENRVSKLFVGALKAKKRQFKTKMTPRKEISDTCAPNGPCIPGQHRLFVDTTGNFFPCERVSETSPVMMMGNLDDGIDYQKAWDILNVGRLTPAECKNCWAFDSCTTCGKYCDNNGEWSSELKLSRCNESLWAAEDSLRDYILFNELKDKIEKRNNNV